MTAEQRIHVLERQIKALRIQVRQHEEYIDTVSSPLWKRALFVVMGYRFRRLGRWYRIRWNADASEWDGRSWPPR